MRGREQGSVILLECLVAWQNPKACAGGEPLTRLLGCDKAPAGGNCAPLSRAMVQAAPTVPPCAQAAARHL